MPRTIVLTEAEFENLKKLLDEVDASDYELHGLRRRLAALGDKKNEGKK